MIILLLLVSLNNSASVSANFVERLIHLFYTSDFFYRAFKDYFKISNLIWSYLFLSAKLKLQVYNYFILLFSSSLSLMHFINNWSWFFKHLLYFPFKILISSDNTFSLICFYFNIFKLSIFCNCKAAILYFAPFKLKPSSFRSLISTGIFELYK